MWIYENKDWPKFTWNAEKISTKLAELRYSQGRLLGKMQGLGFELKREANLNTLTDEVVKSSAIEGEILNVEEVDLGGWHLIAIARHVNNPERVNLAYDILEPKFYKGPGWVKGLKIFP